MNILLEIVVFVIIKINEGICMLMSLRHRFKKVKKCPPIKDKIIFYSATALANKIRKREITSESVIRAYITRIQEVNPILNAVVENRFHLAIEEAKLVDTMLANTSMSVDELEINYPLLGLPLTVKESIAVEGLSYGAGKVFVGGKKAKQDAEIVKMCKKAGAIVLLVSNTPELCVNFETSNNVTGRTYNPYDNRRTPGGSSGGEAALLGAAASLIGLGSDLCGSIRLPAHYCGIWGHKPSARIISIDGHYPASNDKSIWNEIFVLGPMSRYSEDLLLMFKVLLKSSYTDVVQLHKEIYIPTVQFYYMKDYGGSLLVHSIDKEIEDAIENLVFRMKSNHGCKVQELKMKEFKYCPEIYVMNLISLDHVDEIYEKNKGNCTEEFVRYLTLRSNSNFMTIFYTVSIHTLKTVTTPAAPVISKLISRFKTKLCEKLGPNGVLIYPTHHTASHLHGQAFGRLINYAHLGIFNSLGLPVTNCPLGLNSKGLPIGVQVVAALNNDRLTLAVAQEIERLCGGWIPPVFSEASE